MVRRGFYIPLFTACLLLLFAIPSDLSSCGPFFTEAVFTRATSPDNELVFAKGQLGILQPSFRRVYLIAAYRILNGLPMSESQAEAIRHRREAVLAEQAPPSALEIWKRARLSVPGTQPVEIEQYRTLESFVTVPGCSNDALITATQTLTNLERQAGPASQEVKIWLSAQDAVFSNCDGKHSAIPEALPSGQSYRERANRAYQIAAAHFYAGQWDAAKEEFRQIAADGQSTWHEIAAYLVARVDVRRGDYKTSHAQLEAILSNPKLATIHAKARSLITFLEAKLDPAGYMKQCAAQLLARNDSDLSHALNDYTFLYDHYSGEGSPSAAYNRSDFLNLAKEEPLTNWISSFQTDVPQERQHKLDRWNETHSAAWLIAALHSSWGAAPGTPALVDAALHLAPSSPAYLTARFHAIRLLIELNRSDEARAQLQQVSRDVSGADVSTQNAFRAEQLKVARSFDEFLASAPRTIAGEGYDDPTSEFEPATRTDPPLSMFDHDGAFLFNVAMPLELWLRAAGDVHLSPILRTELAQAGLVRALLIQSPSAESFSKVLSDLKPSYRDDLAQYVSAPREARQFTAVYWILRHPELNPWIRAGFQREAEDGQIDNFRDNWWCGPAGGRAWLGLQDTAAPTWNSPLFQQLYPQNGHPPTAFLEESEKESGRKETEAIDEAGGAPTYLSSVVVARSKSHPDDSRLPEALALAVKTSHYGCTAEASDEPVKEAFRILHTRFPNTDWARRTPYWYGSQSR